MPSAHLRGFILAGLGLLVTAGCRPPREKTRPAPRATTPRTTVPTALKLAQAVQREEPALKGIVVGLVRRNGWTWVRGLGHAGGVGAHRLAGNRVFQIASLTKPFTALLLARAVVRGRVRLADLVTQCAAGQTSGLCYQGHGVTYASLAEHYSGLPRVPGNLRGSAREYGRAQLEAFLRSHRLRRRPGEHFEYSTTGYGLLGLKLVRLSRAKNLQALLQRDVLGPLGLISTTFTPGAHHRGVVRPALEGSGGLFSTANDLLWFLRAQIRLPRDRELAAAITLSHLTPGNRRSFPGSVTALGWHKLQATNWYWHAGFGARSAGFAAFDPRRGRAVVLLSSSRLSPRDIRLARLGFQLLALPKWP